MALQINLGASGLTALGIGAGDLSTLYALGQTVGNWVTASSNDKQFLDLLKEEEGNLLRRRAIVDRINFRQRWCKRMTLLQNDRPRQLTGRAVESVLEDPPQFTICMMCIVAALDEFASSVAVQEIVRLVLTGLLDGDNVDELLASQLVIRVNSWRSAATVREISRRCREIRRYLEEHKKVVVGFMPIAEAPDVAKFLQWILAGDTNEFHTASSDIFGIAVCLTEISFEVLSVDGLGLSQKENTCVLFYSPKNILSGTDGEILDAEESLTKRELSTTVSLDNLDETMSNFPIDKMTANKCRAAWKHGQQAGKFIDLKIRRFKQSAIPPMSPETSTSFKTEDKGSAVPRVESGIFNAASALGIVVNAELCDNLSQALQYEMSSLDWVLQQVKWTEEIQNGRDIANRAFGDKKLISAFCVFQAFFMGYYYDIFLRLVDVSDLRLPIVAGNWGYRSSEFLIHMRSTLRMTDRSGEPHALTKGMKSDDSNIYSRDQIIIILSSLFCNYTPSIIASSTPEICLGVVSKLTLLTYSLLKECKSPEAIGRFVILDVDTGGIPRDSLGIVRSGLASSSSSALSGFIPYNMREIRHGKELRVEELQCGPESDCTKHIEADWQGRPENLVLCIRYKGRRLGIVNPGAADRFFVDAYEPPSESPEIGNFFAAESTIEDFLKGKLVYPQTEADKHYPVVVKARGAPCLRYAAIFWYNDPTDVAMSSNCIHAASRRKVWVQGRKAKSGPKILIHGQD